jgi:thiol:disulfide interchange protein DsbD
MARHRNYPILLFLSLILLSSNAFLENKYFASNSSFEVIPEKNIIDAENEIFLIIRFNLDKDWHTYWINPGDSGDPASFNWNLPEGFNISEPIWPTPELIPYPPLTTFGYTDELKLLFKLTLPKKLDSINKFSVISKWLVCADVCIPQEGKVSFVLSKGSSNDFSIQNLLINDVKSSIPRVLKQKVSSKIEDGILTLNLNNFDSDIEDAYFFPYQENVIDYSINQKLNRNLDGTELNINLLNKNKSTGLLGGVLKTNIGNYEIELDSNLINTQSTLNPEFISLSAAILFSLIGGLLLNLMPCVFPVISLKILNFVNHSENKKQTSLHGFAFSAGSILMFVLVGLSVVLLKGLGMDIGWGYQLQSPLIVSLLIFLFIFLAGFFLLNVNFLNSLLNIGSAGVSAPSYMNSFGTGFLAVIVATPCTAPFMGSALGFAILQPSFSSFLIFLFLGIGFAFPYILLSVFPSMLSLLPKPGAWMETFKQFMAFPMILTALWLVWVLSSQIESFQLVLVLLGISLIVFFYWLNQLKIFSKAGLRFRNFIYLAVLVSLFFTLPIEKSSFEIERNSFSNEELTKRLAEGPVFLNFTADWCITCKVNERVALKTNETLKFFEDRNIFYLEADWTNKNELITKKLASFGRSSIPLYIYYPGEKRKPIILPEILTESVIKDYLN